MHNCWNHGLDGLEDKHGLFLSELWITLKNMKDI